MWSVFLKLASHDEFGVLGSQLWDAGTIGIEETPDGLRAYFESSIHPETVCPLFAGYELTLETDLPPVFVQEAADREPIFAGKRFVIVAANGSTENSQASTARLTLPIDAAMAFGSGRHETTQLCLEALELCLRTGDTVFDVGCGSGILCLAAEKLGAACVIGADIDEASIAVARRHFKGPLFAGSADGFPNLSADIVLSNITGPVNEHIANDLRRIVKPAGKVIISGFTEQTKPRSFQAEQILCDGDWQCWICTRDGINPQDLEPQPNVHKAEWWL